MKGGDIHIPGLGGGANNHPNKFISVNGVMRDDSFDLGSKSTAFFLLILSFPLFNLQHQVVIDQVMAPIILNLRAHSKLLLVSHDYRQSITVSIASNLNITAISNLLDDVPDRSCIKRARQAAFNGHGSKSNWHQFGP